MQISSLYYKLQISNYQLYLACCSVVPCQFVAYQEVYRKDDVQPTFRKQGTGTRKGGRTRGIKELPRAISHPRHKINIFITVACHASAPIMAKAFKMSHLFFHISLFSHLPPPNSHTHATRWLHACNLPQLQLDTDLSDLIIIEVSSNNYQYKETSSGELEQIQHPATPQRRFDASERTSNLSQTSQLSIRTDAPKHEDPQPPCTYGRSLISIRASARATHQL